MVHTLRCAAAHCGAKLDLVDSVLHVDPCPTPQEDVRRYVLPSIAARLAAIGALSGSAAGALKRSLADLIAYRRATALGSPRCGAQGLLDRNTLQVSCPWRHLWALRHGGHVCCMHARRCQRLKLCRIG